MKEVSNGKSINNTGDVMNESPTLVWNQTMLTYASTMSIVLAYTEVSTNEYSHDMDDTDTQVFGGHAKFVTCLQEIIRKEEILSKHNSETRKSFWRITCIKNDGHQNYEVRDFSQFMSLVALEIGTMVHKKGKNLDHWWKSNKEDHSSIVIGNFAEQLLEVKSFLNNQTKDNG